MSTSILGRVPSCVQTLGCEILGAGGCFRGLWEVEVDGAIDTAGEPFRTRCESMQPLAVENS